MEKRRDHRLYTNLPIEYRVIFHDQTGQLASRAKIKNISHGGAYLEFDQPPELTKGLVGHFTFTSLTAQEEAGAVHLAAKAIVRRIDRQNADAFSFGLALEFLSGPLIFYQERSADVN
jgi:hypothetical protein